MRVWIGFGGDVAGMLGGCGPGGEPALEFGGVAGWWKAARGCASGVESWLGIGGHFEEVEDTAHRCVESSQGLGDLEPTRLDEADGEASQAGGVFGSEAGADAASVFIP